MKKYAERIQEHSHAERRNELVFSPVIRYLKKKGESDDPFEEDFTH